MIEYTIDDAIERCKDRANISALHHMMRTGEADQACGPEL